MEKSFTDSYMKRKSVQDFEAITHFYISNAETYDCETHRKSQSCEPK